ncbi:hypothetical protein IAQ61_004112 [Plenodomus lingam]|uniref:uncharacterized protein n=1 Tax=Leptosphaeria maculans TaxID=5022 RepID=UPI00332C2185|nr:hypothetical protein IAQ61_004112 [Plenodomus lingam]
MPSPLAQEANSFFLTALRIPVGPMRIQCRRCSAKSFSNTDHQRILAYFPIFREKDTVARLKYIVPWKYNTYRYLPKGRNTTPLGPLGVLEPAHPYDWAQSTISSYTQCSEPPRPLHNK